MCVRTVTDSELQGADHNHHHPSLLSASRYSPEPELGGRRVCFSGWTCAAGYYPLCAVIPRLTPHLMCVCVCVCVVDDIDASYLRPRSKAPGCIFLLHTDDSWRLFKFKLQGCVWQDERRTVSKASSIRPSGLHISFTSKDVYMNSEMWHDDGLTTQTPERVRKPGRSVFLHLLISPWWLTPTTASSNEKQIRAALINKSMLSLSHT